MRIFTRYILAEVLSYAVLGGVLFTFVLFMRDLGKILELVVRNSASPADAGRLFLYTLPNALTVTIPMAVLVGILLGLSRLAADSEITAMRSVGMGALQFVRILSLVSVGALLLALLNSLWLAPRAAASLLRLEGSLKSSQASFAIEPRVFYEDFRNYVLFVQDVRPVVGASLWHHLFLADVTDPANPGITTAENAIVVSERRGVDEGTVLRLHLEHGGQHQLSARDPNQYTISTFSSTDVPIEAGGQEDTHVSRLETPILALSLRDLLRTEHVGDDRGRRLRRIEFNRRFSYPFACFVLMLVGVPLGLSSKRGGKSTGFVLTLLLVFLYYFLSSIGVAFAKNGKLSPFLGVWGANLLFSAAGALLLYQLSRGGVALSALAKVAEGIRRRIGNRRRDPASEASADLVGGVFQRTRSIFGSRFPLLLDDYVLRSFLTNFALVLAVFALLFLIFTFFELIGDIIRNRTPLVTVGDYLLNLIPYILYNTTPLCSLVAVLTTFGSLQRTSELTAMKATGISLYRVVVPVLVLAGAIAAGLFAFDEFYLPAANRRQEALRAVIKGKPPQTFLRPDRKWMSGQMTRAGDPARIFYYQFFDADQNRFANLTVFEFDPASFTLRRRIFAASARWDPARAQWVFANGWERSFAGETVSDYKTFAAEDFAAMHETPAYFKKEDRPSQEMNFNELSRYIADLRQSGFETMRLRVQLNRKLAYPLVTLVMAVLGIPFAVGMGRRGSLAGIGAAIALAIAYWVIAGVSEAMGNVNTLPAALAAWTPDLLFGFAGTYLLLRTPT